MILIGDRVEQGLGVLPPLVLIPSSLGPILHDAPVGPECSCPCHFPTMAADGRVVNAVRPTSTGSVIGREATSHPPRPVSGPGHAPEARRAWGSLTRDAGPGPIRATIWCWIAAHGTQDQPSTIRQAATRSGSTRSFLESAQSSREAMALTPDRTKRASCAGYSRRCVRWTKGSNGDRATVLLDDDPVVG